MDDETRLALKTTAVLQCELRVQLAELQVSHRIMLAELEMLKNAATPHLSPILLQQKIMAAIERSSDVLEKRESLRIAKAFLENDGKPGGRA